MIVCAFLMLSITVVYVLLLVSFVKFKFIKSIKFARILQNTRGANIDINILFAKFFYLFFIIFFQKKRDSLAYNAVFDGK